MAETPYIAESTWRHFWHPVCTLKELRKNPDGRGKRMRVRLLGDNLVVAETTSGVIALTDKCAHRSSSLSLGWVEGDCVRCPYHGWVYNGKGECVEIPAAPDMPIPPSAKVASYAAQVAYDHVWVRLDSALDIPLPACPDWDDPEMKCLVGEPYLWKTSAARRLENFVDLSHFAFIHDGSLGTRAHPLVSIPEIDQTRGEMRYSYFPDPKTRRTGFDLAPVSATHYRILMPFGVNLDIHKANSERIGLWMVASPVESGICRSFWLTNRKRYDDPDQPHLDLQTLILREDITVIESQEPREIPSPQHEISIPVDKVSIHYRRWLHQMSRAAEKGPEALAQAFWAERFETDKRDAVAAA